MSDSHSVLTSGSWCHVSKGMLKMMFVHFHCAQVKQNALTGAVLYFEGSRWSSKWCICMWANTQVQKKSIYTYVTQFNEHKWSSYRIFTMFAQFTLIGVCSALPFGSLCFRANHWLYKGSPWRERSWLFTSYQKWWWDLLLLFFFSHT